MRPPNPYRFLGLVIAATFAILGDWSLAEFCWSTWLAGLSFTWLCVITGGLQIVATAPTWRASLDRRIPELARWSNSTVTLLTIVTVLCLMALAFYAYTFAFGFYGLFLSVFAEMEPKSLFGRNGFINSDFWTPVRYLAATFWPMTVGTIVAYGRELSRSDPWRRMLLPLATELVRIHVTVLAMPFLALGAWAVLGDSYQSVVVVVLMVLYYLLPRRGQSDRTSAAHIAAPDETSA